MEAYQKSISQIGSENKVYFFDYEVPDDLLRKNFDSVVNMEEENFIDVDIFRQLPCIDDMFLNTLNNLVDKKHNKLILKILDYFVDFILNGFVFFFIFKIILEK